MVQFFLLSLLASLIVLIFLVSRVWTVRHTEGAVELFLCSLSCGIWALGYGLEIITPTLAEKLFWAKFQYLGIATVPVWVVLFILRYSGRAARLHNRHAAALLALPALSILFTYTNELHHMVWTSIAGQPGWMMAPLTLGHGWWFWVVVAYSYILLVIGTALLVQQAFRTQRYFMNQIIIMLAAMMVPWVGNALYILGLRPQPNLDLTPLTFALTNIGLMVGFLRFRLLDILPVAYPAVFEFMGDGVVVLDNNQRVVDMNPAARQIFIQPVLSPPTQPLRNVQHRELDGWIGQHMQKLLPGWQNAASEGPAFNEKELRLPHGPDGKERVYALRTTAILNRSKQVTGQVLMFSDITQLKNAEEVLKAAHQQAVETNRLKTQLLANVSHDMRTPLGAIIGFAEMLNSGVYGDLGTTQKDVVSDIQDSGNQLLLFVNNLIGQAQFETGKILIKPKRFQVDELLEDCRPTANLQALRKGIKINYQVDPGMPKTLIGDLYWLRQIAANLVNNAVKFTDQGSVTLRLYQPDPQHWAMEVTDTGPGILPEFQKAIFEPFRQVSGQQLHERGGSGLGLAIVKELTNLMGGQMNLASQPGVGSIFTACFPIQPEE